MNSFSRTFKMFALAAVALACTKNSETQNTENATTATADLGTVERMVIADGSLSSSASIPLVVKRVQWIWEYTIASALDEGTFVKSGDVVIKLDPAKVQKELDDAKLALDKAILQQQEEKVNGEDRIADALANVKTATINLQKAKLMVTSSDTVSAVERKKELLEVASAEAFQKRAVDKVPAVREQAKKALAMQQLNVEQEKQKVLELEQGLAKLEIRASQDGIVIYTLFSRNGNWNKARPGVTVEPNTTLGEVADPKALVVRTFLPEVDASGVAVGTTANVSLEVNPAEVIQGKVTKVSSLASTQAEREGSKSTNAFQNVRQIEATVTLDSLPSLATPGMTAKVVLLCERKENVLRIPVDYLSLTTDKAAESAEPIDKTAVAADATAASTATTTKKKFYVKTRESKDKWQWKEVDIGTVGSGYVEITKGLSAGNEVRSPRL